MNSLWETIALITFVGTQDPATVLRVLATRLTATQAEIIRTLDAVGYLDEYLISRNLRDVWYDWLDHEIAFRQIASCRLSIRSAGDKLLFSQLAFVLMDDMALRPISREIEQLLSAYSRVRANLIGLTPSSTPIACEETEILGTSRSDLTPSRYPKHCKRTHVPGVMHGVCCEHF